MKRLAILLLTTLLATTFCFSQTTSKETNQDSIVYITSNQLKYANLIFVEHDKLLNENQLLYLQLDNFRKKLKYSEEIDSLRLSQIDSYNKINKEYLEKIQKLNKSVVKKNKTILGLEVGCFTVTVAVVLLLLLK